MEHDVKSMSVEGPLEPGTTFRWKSGSATLRSTLLRGFIPSVLKGYGRKFLHRSIDGILRSLKIEAERRAGAPAT